MRATALFLLFGFALASFGQGVVIGPRLGTPHRVDEGLLLVSELNCVACHQLPNAEAARLASRKSPNLGNGGLRLTPQFLRKHIADPIGYKAGTTMPDLLHAMGGDEKREAVDALVHFLISQQTPEAEVGTAGEDFLLKQGRTLYHTIGCVACHEPQAGPDTVPGITPEDPQLEQMDESLRSPASVPLGDLARKTRVEQVAKFLLDPLKVRPSGRMPAHNLSAGEATALAVYLLREQIPAARERSQRALLGGLRFYYYEENFGSTTKFDSLTPKASGTVDTFSIKPRKRDTFFGFRFSGTIRVPRDGTYTFFVQSDDG